MTPLKVHPRKALFVILAWFAAICFLGTRAQALDLESFNLPKRSLKKKPAKSPTSVASVRGLDEPEGSGDPDVRDYEAVERMEKLSVNKEEVSRFAREGHLKEKQ